MSNGAGEIKPRRAVKYAVLHGLVKVPDAAQIGPTVHSSQSANNPGYVMYLDDDTNELVVESVDPKTKKAVIIRLPKSSVSHFQLKD